MAVKEANLKLGLKLENAFRQGGLSDPKRARSLEDAPMRVNRIKSPKDRQFQPPVEMAMRHCGSPSKSKRNSTENRLGELSSKQRRPA
jgi:hypothetical protein